MRVLTLTLAVAIFGCVSAQLQKPNWNPKFLGQTQLRHAAFVSMYIDEDDSLPWADRWQMFVSTFDPLALGANDDVRHMRGMGNYLDEVALWHDNYLEVFDTSTVWPNNPDNMPSNVVGVQGIIQTSGFLVTSKKDGKLQMYNTTMDPPGPPGGVNIAENDSNEWAYHHVIWQDMDLDGDLDAVTARFHVPTVGTILTEFLWLENPNLGMVPEWATHVITTAGPDISFVHTTLSSEGRDYDCFIFTEFWEQKLTVYWTDSITHDWTQTDLILSREIDTSLGQAFDLIIDDINKDGVDELVVTAYDTVEHMGSVYVYSFPEDFRVDDWSRISIADGFVPNNYDGEMMSPGTPLTFYPNTEYENDLAADGLPHKPFILVSGDDDGRLYCLSPVSDDRNDWSYEKHVILDTDADTVGKMAVADLDNDGYIEIVVPAYSVGELFVFSYAP